MTPFLTAQLIMFQWYILCADDKFRDRFLWGRRPMLAAVAARLPKPTDNVWVDLGGGTGVCYLLFPCFHLPHSLFDV